MHLLGRRLIPEDFERYRLEAQVDPGALGAALFVWRGDLAKGGIIRGARLVEWAADRLSRDRVRHRPQRLRIRRATVKELARAVAEKFVDAHLRNST